MTIIKYTLTQEQSKEDPFEHRVLQKEQVEIRVYLNKKGPFSKNSGHAAMRYSHPDKGEIYVSLFPDNNNNAHSKNPLCHRAMFQEINDDLLTYRDPIERNGPSQRSKYRATYYLITPDDHHIRLDIIKLHQSLLSVISSENNGTVNTLSEKTYNASSPIIHYKIPDNEQASCHFNFYANNCVASSRQYNCTSLLVTLLSSGGLSNDLSLTQSLLRLSYLTLFSLSLGYAASEGSRIQGPSDPEPADEILGVITLITAGVGGLWYLLYLFSSLSDTLNRINRAILTAISYVFCHCCYNNMTNPLLSLSMCGLLIAIPVTLLATATLIVHIATTQNPLSDQNFNITDIVIGAGTGIVMWLLYWLSSWLIDWQNGCANPAGLKRMLDRAATLQKVDSGAQYNYGAVSTGAQQGNQPFAVTNYYGSDASSNGTDSNSDEEEIQHAASPARPMQNNFFMTTGRGTNSSSSEENEEAAENISLSPPSRGHSAV